MNLSSILYITGFATLTAALVAEAIEKKNAAKEITWEMAVKDSKDGRIREREQSGN